MADPRRKRRRIMRSAGGGYLGALDSTFGEPQGQRNESAERTLKITNGSETREVEVFCSEDGLLFLHDMDDADYDCCEPLPDDSDASVVDVYSMMATDPSLSASLSDVGTWKIVR